MRMRDLGRARCCVLEQPLHLRVERGPCARRIRVHRRASRESRPTSVREEGREPLDQIPDDITGYPPSRGDGKFHAAVVISAVRSLNRPAILR
jgi:hypothetical protein